jgi:hypothetical protein
MRRRARIFTAFGAYLCLATHLAAILHVLVVRHATCPGHGEVVHGELPALSEAPLPAGQAAVDATPEAAEADEHCLLVATRRRELAGLVTIQQPVVLAPAATSIDSPPVLPAAPPQALLRLAPKTSPPAVA